MLNMGKLILYCALIISLLAGCGAYILFFSPRAKVGLRNKANSYRVRPGMSIKEATDIMGYKGQELHQNEFLVYQYEPQQLAADCISITIGKDNLVHQVNHGDN
jgi:hypothetical protein